ncbi:hypothetical protein [Listeria booriae]|uniref:hypothetical protein n=1 Tax=Listeria booriae TaxID=1552123 RepID=UPI001626CD3E|nr:hypothetical protein [Listeria booriae]MBC2324660.1 hypothetical protein [Listeria booriae]
MKKIWIIIVGVVLCIGIFFSINGYLKYKESRDKEERITAFQESLSDDVKRELNEHGITRYLSRNELIELENKYEKNGNMSSSEKYLLSNGKYKLTELNPSELSYAINQIPNVGNGKKSFEGFIRWVDLDSSS